MIVLGCASVCSSMENLDPSIGYASLTAMGVKLLSI